MTYALTLRFDPDSEAAISALWRTLADAETGAGMFALLYPPHLSLTRLEATTPPALLDAALDRLASPEPLILRLGQVRRFPGTPFLYLGVDANPALLTLQRHALAAIPEHLQDPHYRPGAWVPHVTIRQDGPDIDRAMALAIDTWRPLSARCIAADLVGFPPARVLRSRDL